MGKAVDQLCGVFAQAVRAMDGEVLGKLLAGASPIDEAQLRADLLRGGTGRGAAGLPSGWAAVVEGNIGLRRHLAMGEFDLAFEQQASSFSAFILCFGKATTNWVVPAMNAASAMTRRVARMVEKHVSKTGVGVPGDALKTAAELMRKAWNAANRHKDAAGLSTSKKLAALNLVNLLLQIYFERKEVRQCKHFTVVVDHSSFPDIALFPVSQRVTYRYFLGRLHMFEDQFVEAEKVLVQALDECTTAEDARKNRRLIVQSLVLARAHVGKLPRPELLDKYGITPVFGPIVDSLRTGNVRAFHAVLKTFRAYFIRAGLYLVVSRLETLVLRKLFQRVALLTGGSRLPLQSLVTALDVVGVKSDIDEAACLVSNMIYQKLVLGYVAYKAQLVVIRSTNAFPPVKSLKG